MKRFIRLSMVLLAIACNNDDDNGSPGNQQTSEPFRTEIGIPLGSGITSEIGASGGQISSEDGMLDIIVPEGAVGGTTTFGILPLISHCPGGLNSYRLLPENVSFNTPVTLVFHYNDENLSGTLPELLGIAYQADDKVWYTLPDVDLDQTAKTVSVDVTHFTDWTMIEHLSIFPKIPAISEVRVKEKIDLTVIGQGMSQEEDVLPPLPRNPGASPAPTEDELPPLPIPRPFKAQWYVNDVANGNPVVGTITKGDAVSHISVYTAPDKVPAGGRVIVKTVITGLKKWTMEGGAPKVSAQNEVTLLKEIRILPTEYNYTLKIETIDDFACGYAGQSYHDVAQIDVHIKEQEVSISNIQNQAATVSPLTLNVLNCDLTCNPGSIGHLNITSGSGKVYEPGSDGQPWTFELDLFHTELSLGGVITLACPDADPIVHNNDPFDHTDILFFELTDSVQHGGSPPGQQYGYFVTLTPKR